MWRAEGLEADVWIDRYNASAVQLSNEKVQNLHKRPMECFTSNAKVYKVSPSMLLHTK